jgi:hypothetical protein
MKQLLIQKEGKMAITKTINYWCGDGKCFEDREQAAEHEMYIRVERGVEELLSTDTELTPGYAAVIAGRVARHYKEIDDIIRQAYADIELP